MHAHILNKPSVSRLLRNTGKSKPGYFSDITESAGVERDNVVVVRKGDPVYDNQGNIVEFTTTFADEALFGPSTRDFGAAFADFDGDGKQDLLVNGDGMATQIYWNNGVGKDGKLTFNPCKPSSKSYYGLKANPVFGECGYVFAILSLHSFFWLFEREMFSNTCLHRQHTGASHSHRRCVRLPLPTSC
jgi:hypothetical protein